MRVDNSLPVYSFRKNDIYLLRSMGSIGGNICSARILFYVTESQKSSVQVELTDAAFWKSIGRKIAYMSTALFLKN